MASSFLSSSPFGASAATGASGALPFFGAAFFFTGRGFNTLPMLVYSMQRNGLPPSVLAYSSLIVIFVLAAVLLLLPFVLRMLVRGAAQETT